MQRRLVFLLLSGMVAGASAQKLPNIILWKTSPEVIDQTVRLVPTTAAARYELLRRYFEAVECRGADLRDQDVKKTERKNLICTLPGQTSELIVIAEHYDFKGKGAGVIDDWSGAVMLPLLYGALHATKPQHTFIFAEFAGRDGARAFVESISKKQRKSVVAMLGLESLGLGPADYFLDENDDAAMLQKESQLADLLRDASQLLRLPKEPKFERVWESLSVDDTEAFHRAGIPALLIHSDGWETRKIAGSDRDRVEAIDRASYFEAYALLSNYASYLDHAVDGVFSGGSRYRW